MATMEYETENDRYEPEPRYDRDRSASPRPSKREDDNYAPKRDDSYAPKREDSYHNGRDRSASPNGRVDSRGPPPSNRNHDEREANARNPGSNLFVTGIHPRLVEVDVSRLFNKYGEVELCSIMKDPHTQESRGFGFVKMVTPEQADAAKEALQGEVIEGRTLSIEKARRARPRTPTPGKYFGPPKREEDFRGGPRGGRFDRYEDRRGGGYGGYGSGRHDDNYRSSRYEDRDRRSYGRRDDYGSRNIDRYASGGRDDRYSSRGDDRRGGGDYARDSGRSGYGGYGDLAPSRDARDSYGGRALDDRPDDRYSRR
ncbi:MAG: hypothetical protein HETSPECPRED_008577 [Heterodermia speciosa]|uniref:RRM domain-containing protein n=1 Tax=Heterodermia speciosa TaxID=116794 RepID=A0A8H3FYD5_9LECA|nr:MAG: hypothetical protein HETSPECPRED_008577 [Heterodermia speciosa]